MKNNKQDSDSPRSPISPNNKSTARSTARMAENSTKNSPDINI